MTGRLWDLSHIGDQIKDKKFKKAIKQQGLDMNKIDEINKAIKIVKNRLEELESWTNFISN